MMSDSPRVTVYTSQFCGFCTAAKRLLERQAITYEEIDLSQDHAQRQAIIDKTGWRTVPVICVDEQLVGGYQELMALCSRGGLEHLKTQQAP